MISLRYPSDKLVDFGIIRHDWTMIAENPSLFSVIVEKGSLVAASREMGLSTTSVSERLAALVAHYGVTLLNRTTRSISLTDEGRLLL